MKKKELVQLLEPFDDEIDIFIIDQNDLVQKIKHIYYNIKQRGMGRIIIEPFGSNFVDTKDSVRLK